MKSKPLRRRQGGLMNMDERAQEELQRSLTGCAEEMLPELLRAHGMSPRIEERVIYLDEQGLKVACRVVEVTQHPNWVTLRVDVGL